MEHYDIDLRKLQSIVDLIASLMNVPAGIIMRLDEEFIEVLVSSNTSKNPYKAGDKEEFHNSGLYCETVIRSNSILIVPNALNDAVWKNNLDVRLGMISYLGLPINLPSGKPFGTICVLDNKENHYCNEYIQLLTQFRNLVEDHFQILDYRIKLARTETWKATVRTIMDIVNNAMNNMIYFQMKMEKSDDFTKDDIALYQKTIKKCSTELLKMSGADEVNICHKNFGNIIQY